MFFLTAPFFTTSFSLLKSTGTGTNLSTSNLSTLLFKFLKLLGTFLNLSMSSLSTSDFKLTKSVFLAKSDVSTSAAFCKSVFVLHNWINLIRLPHLLSKISLSEKIHSL